MKRYGFALVAALVLLVPAVWAETENHSLSVNTGTWLICTDGARYTATTTAAGAVGLPMTAEVCDAGNSRIGRSAGSVTFASVGASSTFTVLYPSAGVAVGDNLIISVTDTPDTGSCNNGSNGWSSSAAALTVPATNCSLIPVTQAIPTLSQYGIAGMLAVLGIVGAVLLRRRRR